MRIHIGRVLAMFLLTIAVLIFVTSPVAADKGKGPDKKFEVASNSAAKKFPPTTPSPPVIPKNPPPKYVKNPPGFCVPTWRCVEASPTSPKPGKGPKIGKGPKHGGPWWN